MRKISRKHLSVRSVQVALYVHTLQLVVKVFETAPAYSRTVKSAVAVAKKVNKSCIEQLKQLAGEKLVKNCPTRSIRMLQVKEHLTTISEELELE